MFKWMKAGFLAITLAALTAGGAFGAVAGDIDRSDKVDLADVLAALGVCTDTYLSPQLYSYLDADGNNRIDLADAAYALQVVAQLRDPLPIWFKDADGDGYSDGTGLRATSRPDPEYFEESELTAISGDLDDNDPNVYPQTTQEAYSLPSFDTVPTIGEDGESLISLLGGNTPNIDHVGEPILPVIPARIVLPQGHVLDYVKVTEGQAGSLTVTHDIEHGQQPYPLLPDVTPEPTEKDVAIYGSDDPYPGRFYDIVTVQKQAGVTILFMALYPVQYKPLSKELIYYENLTVEAITIPDPDARRRTRHDIIARPERVTTAVDNPEMLATYETASEPARNARNSGLCDPSEDYRYVVITPKAIRDAGTSPSLNDLIARRESMGLTATIVTTEDIYAAYSGTDNPEKIRNFIIDAYNCWETQFVLLGGDKDTVPMRKLWADPWDGSGYDDHIPSDIYYQCLDGNFNRDGDSKWGEAKDGAGGEDVDLLAEVYIGRASAENADEMSHFIHKTLTYETDGGAYKKAALIVGEHLGFGGDSEYAKKSMEEIRKGSSQHGYETRGFASDGSFTADTLYEQDDSWEKADVMALIDANQYGIINHLGHSNYNYVMKMYNSDADSLSNGKYIFAYSQGCIPGNYEKDCIAERLTSSTRSAMFAVVFNSRYGWGTKNSTDGPSQRFNRELWHAYFGEGIKHLGAMNAYSHEKNTWRINDSCMRWCYYESNLLGDPALMLGETIAGGDSPPSAPTNVRSTSHTAGEASTDATVDMEWTAATDPDNDLSGYATLWDHSASTNPTEKTLGSAAVKTTSAPLAAGADHYFHIRAMDAAGNYSDAVHLGPFVIEEDDDTFTNSVGMTFKQLPAGTFQMGSPDAESGRGSDETRHEVAIGSAFFMQITEVTQEHWKAVMGTNPAAYTGCDDCPIENVSWNDAQAFIAKLNELEGRAYRLPSEAEWEYAARAGTDTAFANGAITDTECDDANLDAIGWYCGNSGGASHPFAVAGKAPNAWGLYDMHGNVWEWVEDWYGDYPEGTTSDPDGPSTGMERVLRGGCWNNYALACRSASRDRAFPSNKRNSYGFRVALPELK